MKAFRTVASIKTSKWAPHITCNYRTQWDGPSIADPQRTHRIDQAVNNASGRVPTTMSTQRRTVARRAPLRHARAQCTIEFRRILVYLQIHVLPDRSNDRLINRIWTKLTPCLPRVSIVSDARMKWRGG